MSSFKGWNVVILQPGDTKILVKLKYPVKTSADDTYNYLPYGTTIYSAVVTFTDANGVDVTDDILFDSVIVTDYYITVPLQYPGTAGTYSAKIILTLDDDSTHESDFNRTIAKDL